MAGDEETARTQRVEELGEAIDMNLEDVFPRVKRLSMLFAKSRFFRLEAAKVKASTSTQAASSSRELPLSIPPARLTLASPTAIYQRLCPTVRRRTSHRSTSCRRGTFWVRK